MAAVGARETIPNHVGLLVVRRIDGKSQKMVGKPWNVAGLPVVPMVERDKDLAVGSRRINRAAVTRGDGQGCDRAVRVPAVASGRANGMPDIASVDRLINPASAQQ